jgi:hypothetical protein
MLMYDYLNADWLAREVIDVIGLSIRCCFVDSLENASVANGIAHICRLAIYKASGIRIV